MKMTEPEPAEPDLTHPNLARLRGFIAAFTRLIETEKAEARVLDEGAALLADLIRMDDWLPPAFAAADPARYQQHLLHCDPLERFSVVSFVWGPGQETPVHDHTVWGLIGQLRGAEASQRFEHQEGKLIPTGPRLVLKPGQVEAVSPRIGDIHQVANAADQVSISIHVYGGNIGAVRRRAYGADGAPKTFISGYSNAATPNLWDRSAQARAQPLA
jgi:predicted metal-dependent enzyme (double-stranded beta helix superfamily)